MDSCLSTKGVRVLVLQCATCIFRPGNLMDLRPGRLADITSEAKRKNGYIPCHETLEWPKMDQAICRGFWDRYDTQVLQLARRLGFVEEVQI